jgi:hypothetical protein
LTLSAPGAPSTGLRTGITFKSAQEIDTSSSKNKSTGVDIGVTLSASGLSPNASLNLGKGNSSGRDVTNIESVLTAGGTARIVAGFGGRSGENAAAGGALTLEGAQLSGQRVEVKAGSLAITSQQDTSVFKSKQTNIGVAVSADFGNSGSKGETSAGAGDGKGRAFNGAGASLSFGQTKQSGGPARQPRRPRLAPPQRPPTAATPSKSPPIVANQPKAATALSSAAGSNVAGGLGSLAPWLSKLRWHNKK